jgi:hypothetical protein
VTNAATRATARGSARRVVGRDMHPR